MTLTNPSHKVYLAKLFYPGGQERTFPLTQLLTAAATLKKLMEGSSPIMEGDAQAGVRFSDEPVEFGVEESKLLKDLFDGVKVASISEAELIKELRALLS